MNKGFTYFNPARNLTNVNKIKQIRRVPQFRYAAFKKERKALELHTSELFRFLPNTYIKGRIPGIAAVKTKGEHTLSCMPIKAQTSQELQNN